MATVPARYATLVNSSAARYGVPASVLADLLQYESSWNPTATHFNPAGPLQMQPSWDRGLAQINSIAHPDVTVTEASNPGFAIPWAAKTLAANYRRTGSWSGAVAAYNPGDPGYAAAVLGGAAGSFGSVSSGPPPKIPGWMWTAIAAVALIAAAGFALHLVGGLVP